MQFPVDKPFSAACERNRAPILEALAPRLTQCRHVLEIGSGTGQHAVHFAAALPYLVWQCADRPAYLPGIRLWLDEAALPNTPAPIALDVNDAWPALAFDAVFSANTLHIMAWQEVERFFAHLPRVLMPGGLLAIYGPFRFDSLHTSTSNAAFDLALRADAAHMGIRDFEAVDALARQHGLQHCEGLAMPANNRLEFWQIR